MQKAPITGLTLSIRVRIASVTSVGESCLVRIFSASVTASMRQISFADVAADAGVPVAANAPLTIAAVPAATMNSRRDTPSSWFDFSVMNSPPCTFLEVEIYFTIGRRERTTRSLRCCGLGYIGNNGHAHSRTILGGPGAHWETLQTSSTYSEITLDFDNGLALMWMLRWVTCACR